MNSKGRKTTIVAYAAGVIITALLVGMFVDKISADDFFKGLTAVGTAAAVFIGLLSKDATASHTVKGNQNADIVDPDNPNYPPTKG